MRAMIVKIRHSICMTRPAFCLMGSLFVAISLLFWPWIFSVTPIVISRYTYIKDSFHNIKSFNNNKYLLLNSFDTIFFSVRNLSQPLWSFQLLCPLSLFMLQVHSPFLRMGSPDICFTFTFHHTNNHVFLWTYLR